MSVEPNEGRESEQGAEASQGADPQPAGLHPCLSQEEKAQLSRGRNTLRAWLG